MALRKDEAVTVLPLGVLGVDVQLIKIEGSHHIRRRQGAAGMAGLSSVNHGQNFFAYFLGLGLQAKDCLLICHL